MTALLRIWLPTLLAGALALGASSCQVFGGGSNRKVVAAVSEDAQESADHVMAAIEEGEDELARSILVRMRGFHQDEGTQALIDNVMDVLDGRRLLASLDMALVVVSTETDGHRVRELKLRIVSGEGEEVVLQMTPPALRCRRDWLDGFGNGGHTDDSAALDFLSELTIPGNTQMDVPIMTLDGSRGTAAAIRESWNLEMHFCALETGSATYPVNAPAVRGTERYLLASHLNLGPLDAAPLIETLTQKETPPLPMLIERGVRIPVEGMSAALDELAPVVAQLSMARIAMAAPIFAWLAESSGEEFYYPGQNMALAVQHTDSFALVQGGLLVIPRHLRQDAHAWKLWFARRAELRAVKKDSPLDLPR